MKAERPYGYEDAFSEKYHSNKGFKYKRGAITRYSIFDDIRKNIGCEFGVGVLWFDGKGKYDVDKHERGLKQRGEWYWRVPQSEVDGSGNENVRDRVKILRVKIKELLRDFEEEFE